MSRRAKLRPCPHHPDEVMPCKACEADVNAVVEVAMKIIERKR